MLYAKACAEFIEKRKYCAKTEIVTESGQVIYSMNIIFCVMHEKMFERQFSSQKRDLRKTQRSSQNEHIMRLNRRNPYTNLVSLQYVFESVQEMTFILDDEIRPENCTGHFPQYPMLPVAILASYQMESCKKHLQYILKKEEIVCIFKSGIMRAKNFAFAGDKLMLKSIYQKRIGNDYYLSCESKTIQNKDICKIDVIITMG
jgi:hypothetical protein